MNTTYHYDKLNILLHLEHQRSHYKRVMEAKKYIDLKKNQQSTRRHCWVMKKKAETRVELDRERERKQNNQRLVNKISEIHQKNGILKQMYFQSRKKGYEGAGICLVGRIDEQKVVKDNARLVQKLNDIKPTIGTVHEWNKHFKKFKKAERQLLKNKVYDPENHLRKTISQLNYGRQNLLNSEKNLSIEQINDKQEVQVSNQVVDRRLRKKYRVSSRKIHSDPRQRRSLNQKSFAQKGQPERFKYQINQILRTEGNQVQENQESYYKQLYEQFKQEDEQRQKQRYKKTSKAIEQKLQI